MNTDRPSAAAAAATPPATGRPPWRRPARWLAGGAGVLLALVAAAPTLVAWSPLRHETPRLRLRGFAGPIRVGSASLSWWGPVVLDDVELIAPDGKPFVQVKRYEEERTVFALLFRPDDPSHIRVERPVVTVALRADGSNVEDALRPVLEHPGRRPPKERSISVVDGVVQISDTAGGKSAVWEALGLEIKASPAAGESNTLELSLRLQDAPQADAVTLRAEWQSGAAAAGSARLTARALPLRSLDPLLGRIAPDLTLAGDLSADVQVSVPAAEGARRPVFTIQGDIAAAAIHAASPGRLGADELRLEQLRLHGKLASDGAVLRCDRLALESDVGSATASGALPLALLEQGPTADSGNGPANLELRGTLDLVRLAGLLPATLRLRDDVRLTEGSVDVSLRAAPAQDGLYWKGTMHSHRIAGVVGEEALSWDEPLNAEFAVHREAAGWVLDDVRGESELFEFSGHGTATKAHLSAHSDLRAVTARLRQFLDLGDDEIEGRLTLTADVRREADALIGLTVGATAEELLVRRPVTMMVERRRGDVEPLEPEAPAAGAPRPEPGVPLDRRARRALEKAERDARRDARRRERDERRRAEEIILVPVTRQQTVWNEPRLAIRAEARLDPAEGNLDVSTLEIDSAGVRLTAAGDVAGLPARPVIDLAGKLDYDLNQLVERFRESLGPHVQITGQEQKRFHIAGPLWSDQPGTDASDSGSAVQFAGGGAERPAPGPLPVETGVAPAAHTATAGPPLVPLDLAGVADGGWQRADLFGLEAGPADMELRLEQGIIALRPLAMSLSGGTLHLSPRLSLRGRPAVFTMPAGALIDDVRLSQEVCDDWLKFVAPILSEATRVEGRFSVVLGETRLPLADLAAGSFEGQLIIPAAQILPGPLFAEIGGVVGRIESAVTFRPPSDLLGLERPLVRIDNQQIDFELRDARLHHSPLAFNIRNVIVRTSGSVGTDQSLDLVAEIAFPADWARRVPFLASLGGQSLELPIRGTLRRPRLDGDAFGNSWERLGRGALDSLLNGGLERLFDRN